MSVYGITDTAIVQKIVRLCIDAHDKYPGIHYELHMHPQTKEATEKGEHKTTMLRLILEKEG